MVNSEWKLKSQKVEGIKHKAQTPRPLRERIEFQNEVRVLEILGEGYCDQCAHFIPLTCFSNTRGLPLALKSILSRKGRGKKRAESSLLLLIHFSLFPFSFFLFITPSQQTS